MEKFIACMCDNDLNQLVVSGTPQPEDLFSAWTTLFLEYCDLIDDTETTYKVIMQAKLQYLRKKLSIVGNWVKLLRVTHMPNTAEAIKIMGYDVELDPLGDRDTYKSELDFVEAELRPLNIEIALLEEDIRLLFEKGTSTENQNVERKYFATIFIRLNKYMGYEAIHGQTYVNVYCAALRDYVSNYRKTQTSN